jgi:hypothetical protein
VPGIHTADFEPLLSVIEQGYLVIGSAIDPKDYKEPGVEELVKRTVEEANEGEGHFILLHDGGGDRTQTLAALPGIIAELRKNSFELVSASTLLNRSPDELMPSVLGGGQPTGVRIAVRPATAAFNALRCRHGAWSRATAPHRHAGGI